MPQLLRSALVACALASGAAGTRACGRPARAAVSDESRHEDRPDAAHGASRRAAEAGLHDASLGLRGHRRAEHARRLQRRRARLDPVQRADRPLDGHARHRVPRRFARAADAARPARLDARRRTRCTAFLTPISTSTRRTCSSSPTASRPRTGARSTRRASGRASSSAGRTGSASRSTASSLLGALCWAHVPPATSSTRACSRRRASRRCSRRCGGRSTASHPAPATFAIGSNGERAVFPFASVLGVQVHRQVGTSTFTDSALPAAVDVFPGAIGTVAYGSFSSPNYENSSQVIPPVGSAVRRAQRRRGRTPCTSTSGCRRARSRPAAGPSRSSGTASRTRSRASHHHRVDARAHRHRDDRDQRRRSRRRAARDVHRRS